MMSKLVMLQINIRLYQKTNVNNNKKKFFLITRDYYYDENNQESSKILYSNIRYNGPNNHYDALISLKDYQNDRWKISSISILKA